MEPQGIRDEDQDLSKSVLKHESTSNPAVQNKAKEDMEHVEIRIHGDTCSRRRLEVLEEHLDSENRTLPVNGGLRSHQDIDGGAASRDVLPRPSLNCSVVVDLDLIEEVEEPQASSPLLSNVDCSIQHCPICTNPFDTKLCKELRLRCNHYFCDRCMRILVDNAYNYAVRCPRCRTNTPLTVRGFPKLQEFPMLRERMLSIDATTVQDVKPVRRVCREPFVRRPGFGGTLEYLFQIRLRNRRFGILSRICNPDKLEKWVNSLYARYRCLYYAVLMCLVFPQIYCVYLLCTLIIMSGLIFLIGYYF